MATADTHSTARLEDVAALANVSLATASKALHGKPRVSEDTRERVMEAARQLNYSPNKLAQSLASGRSGTIGLVTSDLQGRFSTPILIGAENELRAQSTSVLLANARGDDALERSHVEKLLSLKVRESYEEQIFNSFRRLDVLQELLDDPEVTEIMVNGEAHIFYEKAGALYPWTKAELSRERLGDMIQQIAGSANRAVNEANPILDTRLSDGSRVNIVLEPVSVEGSCISIRKFSKKPMTLERLMELESLSQEVAEFLKLLVQAGYNIFISGGTGCGKTTFLNALSAYIPKTDRVITIEDSAELQFQNVPNLVRLETRNANGQGAEEISIRDLIRTALRMRPDRIVVGEVRGAEAWDMFQAMNTGHDGSLSTGHANSDRDMLLRLETMMAMGEKVDFSVIQRQIVTGLDILIHLGRMRDRTRKVLQISELCGIKNGEIYLNTLYRFQETGVKGEKVHGIWKKESSLQNRQKLEEKGLAYSG